MKDPTRSIFAFLIGNGCVAIFYYGFWLLGWWIPMLDDLDSAAGEFLPVLWFASFFAASFLSIKLYIKNLIFAVLISLGFAIGLSLSLYGMIAVSHLVLAPFLDPMF
jgi:hypothetical protein